jgi:hypothetical protein
LQATSELTIPTEKEAVILVVTLLLLLIVTLVSSSSLKFIDVSASMSCHKGSTQCCDLEGHCISICRILACKSPTNTTINMNQEAGTTPENNTANLGNTGPSQQQQITATCPDGSTPDANGKCPSSSTSSSPLSPLTTNTKNQQAGPNTNAGNNAIKHCSKNNAGRPNCPKAG